MSTFEGLAARRPQSSSRGRRVFAVGLLAATLAGSMLMAGALVDRREAEVPPTPLPGNGLILITTGDLPILVDPDTGIVQSRSLSDGGPGRALRRLNEATAAAWSPDGTRVAYAAADGFAIVDLATGDVTPIGSVSSASCHSWSPDGTRIAFVVDQDVYVIDRDGTDLTLLHRESSLRQDPNEGTSSRGGRIGPIDLAWSPDGQQLGFLSSGPWDPTYGWALEVVAVDAATGERRVLIDAGDCFCLGWGPPGFAWSPDGTEIAFVTLGYAPKARVHDPKNPRNGGLYVASADGSASRLVVPDTDGSPAWQPVPRVEGSPAPTPTVP